MLTSNNHKISNKREGLGYGLFSIFAGIVLTVFILNFFFQIVPTKELQGLPVLIAPIVSLFGTIIGVIGKSKKANFSMVGIIMNCILLVFSLFYWILGTLVWRP